MGSWWRSVRGTNHKPARECGRTFGGLEDLAGRDRGLVRDT